MLKAFCIQEILWFFPSLFSEYILKRHNAEEASINKWLGDYMRKTVRPAYEKKMAKSQENAENEEQGKQHTDHQESQNEQHGQQHGQQQHYEGNAPLQLPILREIQPSKVPQQQQQHSSFTQSHHQQQHLAQLNNTHQFLSSHQQSNSQISRHSHRYNSQISRHTHRCNSQISHHNHRCNSQIARHTNSKSRTILYNLDITVTTIFSIHDNCPLRLAGN